MTSKQNWKLKELRLRLNNKAKRPSGAAEDADPEGLCFAKPWEDNIGEQYMVGVS